MNYGNLAPIHFSDGSIFIHFRKKEVSDPWSNQDYKYVLFVLHSVLEKPDFKCHNPIILIIILSYDFS